MAAPQVPQFPLAWPQGWKRTAARRSAPFTRYKQRLTISYAIEEVELELRRLGADREFVISTNVKPTLRGSINAITQNDGDPGVAIYFVLHDQGRCLACDTYDRVPDNIHAIAKHIEAMRMSDRYGIGTLDQAFAGYAPRLQSSVLEWWIVLGVPQWASPDQIDAAYKAKMKLAHPDSGGSENDAARLNEARDRALAARS